MQALQNFRMTLGAAKQALGIFGEPCGLCNCSYRGLRQILIWGSLIRPGRGRINTDGSSRSWTNSVRVLLNQLNWTGTCPGSGLKATQQPWRTFSTNNHVEQESKGERGTGDQTRKWEGGRGDMDNQALGRAGESPTPQSPCAGVVEPI